MSLNIDSHPTSSACFQSFDDLIIAGRCYNGHRYTGDRWGYGVEVERSTAQRTRRLLVVLAVPILIGVVWYLAFSGEDPEASTSTTGPEQAVAPTAGQSTTSTVLSPSSTSPDETTTTATATTEVPGASGVYTIAVDGSNPVWLTSGTGPSWSPDGDQIVFEGADGVYTMGADGSNPVWLTNGTAPSWSPNGDQIVFVGTS
jgi:WD40-like Beta Propeller Repeat